jgi:DsbC/DsbD-like thiol-disulfide interchange protein
VSSEPAGVRLGQVSWPETHPFRVAGLDEHFAVYEGRVRLSMPVEFRVPRNSGVVKLEIAIRCQTCSARECLPPDAIALSLAVPETPAL